MVNYLANSCVTLWTLLADDDLAPLNQIDSRTRASVVLALAGLVILGLGMIALVWLGAQHVRRLARHRPIERPREQSSWTALPRIDTQRHDLDDDAN